MCEDTDHYRSIFLNDTPLMDVRAPVEFHKGAFPTAVNLPLLDNKQRQQIGIRYKNAGEQQAIELGLKLATPGVRKQRLKTWLKFCRDHQTGYLYCFRGGLRSKTVQQWLRSQGVEYPLVKGGYKAMRRFLLDELEKSVAQVPLIIVSGLTGSGKTRILHKIPQSIDFEGIANHRGSAFGQNTRNLQPGTIDWENQLSIALLKHRERWPGGAVFLEDEGRCIGRVCIPEILFRKMQAAPHAILKMDLEARIRLIAEDYIVNAWPQYQNQYGDFAETQFSEYVLNNLARIQKRLGGERYTRVKHCFQTALIRFFAGGKADSFYDGIKTLLEQYYDPMYQFQLERKNPAIIFEGSESDYLAWVQTQGKG